MVTLFNRCGGFKTVSVTEMVTFFLYHLTIDLGTSLY